MREAVSIQCPVEATVWSRRCREMASMIPEWGTVSRRRNEATGLGKMGEDGVLGHILLWGKHAMGTQKPRINPWRLHLSYKRRGRCFWIKLLG